MNFFGNNKENHSTSGTSIKVKRQLSIDLNLTKRKRGLSLVSARPKEDQNVNSSRVIKKDQQIETTQRTKVQFPQCPFPTCNLKALSLLE